jgi:hypothetical protein
MWHLKPPKRWSLGLQAVQEECWTWPLKMAPMLSPSVGNHVPAKPAKSSKDTVCITSVTVNRIPNRHLILKKTDWCDTWRFTEVLVKIQGFWDMTPTGVLRTSRRIVVSSSSGWSGPSSTTTFPRKAAVYQSTRYDTPLDTDLQFSCCYEPPNNQRGRAVPIGWGIAPGSVRYQSGEALRHATVSIPGRFTGKLPSDLFSLSAFNSHEVHSASNRNEYQGISLEVQCHRRVELTAVPS